MSHRQTAILTARKLCSSHPVFLDTETTGLDATAEIVEICLIDHDGSPLLHSLVRPLHPIPWGAMRIHNISNEMVADAPSWPEIWPQVRAILQGRVVGVYNAEFDLRMMQQSHRLHGMAWDCRDAEFFCIMKLYARFFGESGRYYDSFRWQSLEKAGCQCGISLPNAHRAFADTLLARAVLQHMAEREF